MADPINKISRSQETDKKTAQGGMIRSEKRKFHREEPSGDSVDISEEARERAFGRKRRTILEYLEDDGGGCPVRQPQVSDSEEDPVRTENYSKKLLSWE